MKTTKTIVLLHEDANGEGLVTLVGKNSNIEIDSTYGAEMSDLCRNQVFFDVNLPKARKHQEDKIRLALSDLSIMFKELEILDEMIANGETEHALNAPVPDDAGIDAFTVVGTKDGEPQLLGWTKPEDVINPKIHFSPEDGPIPDIHFGFGA